MIMFRVGFDRWIGGSDDYGGLPVPPAVMLYGWDLDYDLHDYGLDLGRRSSAWYHGVGASVLEVLSFGS
jgi:hypothetical protein